MQPKVLRIEGAAFGSEAKERRGRIVFGGEDNGSRVLLRLVRGACDLGRSKVVDGADIPRLLHVAEFGMGKLVSHGPGGENRSALVTMIELRDGRHVQLHNARVIQIVFGRKTVRRVNEERRNKRSRR